jgi:hypothetical protein
VDLVTIQVAIVVTIQVAIGHGALVTTGRYLRARPARDQAAVFTRAFQAAASGDELVTARHAPRAGA